MSHALFASLRLARRDAATPITVVGRSRQRGQALVMMLGLAAVGVMACIALYHVAQTANARVRLTHTADAVAYSGAAAQARSLNLLAYINRAQVAHQIAMAHLVTFASWAELGDTQSARREIRHPPASLMVSFFGQHTGKGYQNAQPMGDAVSELKKAFQEHDRVVHDVLQKASASIIANMHEYRRQTMLQVLRANYPEHNNSALAADLKLAQPQHGALQMSMLFDSMPGYVKSALDRLNGHLRDQVEQAANQYDFLRARDETHRSSDVVEDQCPTKRNELRRHGNTHLDAEGHWTSQDSLSYHPVRKNKQIGCYFREYPMGWGRVGHTSASHVSAVEPVPTDFSKQSFWRWVQEYTSWDIFSGDANPLADGYATLRQQRWPGRGLPNYPELNDDRTLQPLRFGLQLRQAATSITTPRKSSGFVLPGGRYAYQPLNADDAVTVVSAAETYFSNPGDDSADSPSQPNLFSPYWRARLIAVERPDGRGQR